MIKRAFTMVEILIVIAIIGLLSVSLIPNLSGAPAKARDLSKKKAVTAANAAIESYKLEKGGLPELNAATDANPGTCLNDEAIAAVTIDLVFDGEVPKATTVSNEADCVDGGDIYPKYKRDGNSFTLSIDVESKASATNEELTKFEISN
jgi:type IV pilus assembly protein PilA